MEYLFLNYNSFTIDINLSGGGRAIPKIDIGYFLVGDIGSLKS